MAKLLKSKKRSILGIDLTGSNIKIVELAYVKQQYFIHSCVSFNQKIHTNTDFSNFLKNNFLTFEACVGISNEEVILEVIKLSGVYSKDELHDIVLLNAQKFLSCCISKFYYDFQLLTEANENQTVVLFIAVPINVVQCSLEFLIKAGINPKILELGSFALERAQKYLVNNNFNFLCNSFNSSYLVPVGLAMRVSSL